MKKLVTAFFVLTSFSLSAQTLFYYGNESVSAEDFLRAYKKNNPDVKDEKALLEYLDLYIASRLKIKEARQRGYDTLPQLVSDLANLRQQIIPAYLNDKESVDRLVNEAYERSQKNIHLAHIFIAHDMSDSAASRNKSLQALKQLNEGKKFSEVARQFSEDPSAKMNGGDIGWISVFTLPYELENLAYSTPVNSVSDLFTTNAGYHIFKNLGERKDPGKIRAAQILLAYPDSDEQTKDVIKKRADSIYQRLLIGDDFGMMATRFSNDIVSAAANGNMQEFGVGKYSTEFENVVFSLSKDGDISKPFETAHGIHIVKRIGVTQGPLKKDEKAMSALRRQVEQSDRMASIKKELAKKVLAKSGIVKLFDDPSQLFLFSDSVLNFKRTGKSITIKESDPLIRIGTSVYTLKEWLPFAQSNRYKPNSRELKPNHILLQDFIEAMAVEHYKQNLEQYNDDFRYQINEFREGNLFFEIMQREIWNPSQSDSTALAEYFNINRAKYQWNKSVDAIIFYAMNEESAKAFKSELQKSPAEWKTLFNNFSESIAADSARFEINQIPNPTKINLNPGTITGLLENEVDKTSSFALIVNKYDSPEPRSFSEARGLVVNDYQQELERKWIARLKEKYPVKINKAVLKKMRKSLK